MKKSSSGVRVGHSSRSEGGHASAKKQAVLPGKQAKQGGKQDLLLAYQRTVFAALFLGYACYTYNRKSVSYALPTLLASGLVTTSSVGIISSCQNTAYAISKFLGGVLSDKISARLLFSVGLGMSGGTALLFSRTENLYIWALLWFLNGFAQGAGWPACAKLLKKWFSPANFGTWWSVLTASSNVSGTVSPLLSAYVIVNHGWGASLILAGLVSVIMAGLTLVALVDDPALVHLPDPTAEVVGSPRPSSPKKERQNGNGNKNSNNNSTSNNQMTVGELAASPFLWIVCLCYMVVFCSKTAVSDWGQIYLMEELGRTQMQASQFTSAMETGGFFGGILAGIVTDRIASKLKIKGNPRLIVASVFMLACAVGLHLLNYILTISTSQIFVSSVGFLLGASMFGPISIYGIVASESFPAHLSGTAHAVVALAANVGAVVAGWPLSWVAKTFSWSGVFLLLETLAAASIVLIVFTRRIHLTAKQKKA